MSQPLDLARRAAGRVRRDLRALRKALLPPATPAPGLYSYALDLPGGRGRIHLRVHPDGTGMLVRDATDAVHLNATAVEMARLALDGVPPEACADLIRRRYRGAPPAHLRELLQAQTERRAAGAIQAAAPSCPCPPTGYPGPRIRAGRRHWRAGPAIRRTTRRRFHSCRVGP